MGHSYEELVSIVGQKKADELWEKAGKVPKKRKDPRPEYTKLSETAHAKLFHKWLDEQGIKHTHIGNESGQAGTKNIVIMMAKKKAVGVSKGYPDYIIYVPVGGFDVQLHIELKKAKGVNGGLNGSIIHKEQVEWAKTITRTVGCFCKFCHGSDEAIEYVRSAMKTFHGMTPHDVMTYWLDMSANFIADLPEPTE